MSIDILETFELLNATAINLLCVLKGGFKFASDLSEKIHNTAVTRSKNIPIFMDFIVSNTYELLVLKFQIGSLLDMLSTTMIFFGIYHIYVQSMMKQRKYSPYPSQINMLNKDY
uniref:Hypoxanthine-guanine phosphoribosyltransferase n=1 Tax=Schistosoma haematobium TaxID=6185 RepID=A0A095BVR6_SCHHA